MVDEISQISARDFERYGAARHPMALQFVEELEFYAVLDGWYLGVLLRDRIDGDFSYAVLGPDPKGSKCWIGGESSVATREASRAALLLTLGEFAAKGRQTFEQD